jgi:acyl-CoA reductase-like NAD-dependent aldehyde dehydrogenase
MPWCVSSYRAALCCAVVIRCPCAELCCAGKGSEIGDYLTTHPAVDCISFTGGDTGISISKKAGMVPLQMELGGKDACIVCRCVESDNLEVDFACSVEPA